MLMAGRCWPGDRRRKRQPFILFGLEELSSLLEAGLNPSVQRYV
jgi:hypothetical protein